MKAELEKKLNKLPAVIQDYGVFYDLIICKCDVPLKWVIQYTNFSTENTILTVEHQSLQAAVDTTLKELKNL